MENFIVENKSCCCTNPVQDYSFKQSSSKAKKTAKALPSMMLSLGIAFFPKCPVCLAAYMSMFGSFSLANTAIMGWLFPLLISFLVAHLLLLLKKSKKKGYGPFFLSLAGTILILSGRILFNQNKAVLLLGMLFILSGSLWNSFSYKRFQPSL